jgi:hypothetical protein
LVSKFHGKETGVTFADIAGVEEAKAELKEIVDFLKKPEECLSKLILFGERSLRRALSEYVTHFHSERNHQGKGNRFPQRVARLASNVASAWADSYAITIKRPHRKMERLRRIF